MKILYSFLLLLSVTWAHPPQPIVNNDLLNVHAMHNVMLLHTKYDLILAEHAKVRHSPVLRLALEDHLHQLKDGINYLTALIYETKLLFNDHIRQSMQTIEHTEEKLAPFGRGAFNIYGVSGNLNDVEQELENDKRKFEDDVARAEDIRIAWIGMKEWYEQKIENDRKLYNEGFPIPHNKKR